MELTTTEIVVEVQPQSPTIVASVAPTELQVTSSSPQDPEIIVSLTPPPEISITIDVTQPLVVTVHEGLPGKPGKDGTGGGGTGAVVRQLSYTGVEYTPGAPYVAGSLGENVLLVDADSGFASDVSVRIPAAFDDDQYTVVRINSTLNVLVHLANELLTSYFNMTSVEENPAGFWEFRIPQPAMEFSIRKVEILGVKKYLPAQTSEWITVKQSLFISNEVSPFGWQQKSLPIPYEAILQQGNTLHGVVIAEYPSTTGVYLASTDFNHIHRLVPNDVVETYSVSIELRVSPEGSVQDTIVTDFSNTTVESVVTDEGTPVVVPCVDSLGAPITFPLMVDTSVYLLFCSGDATELTITLVNRYPTPVAGNTPTASDVTYANQTYPNVAAALDALLNPYVAPDVTLSGGYVAESGSTVNNLSLSFTINKSCTKTINQGVGVVTSSPVALINQGITTQRTYTITADDGTSQDQASTTVSFAHRRWFGPSAYNFSSGTFAQATLNSNGLSSDLSDSKSKGSVTYDCTGGKYPYLIVYGASQAVTAVVSGFPFTDFTKTNITIPDAAGVNQTYTCCKFNNIQNGTLTVVWS